MAHGPGREAGGGAGGLENQQRAFVGLWWTLGLGLFYMCAYTVHEAVAARQLPDAHVAILTAIEGVASLLLLIPRTIIVGATGLIIALAAAFLLHLIHGEARVDLLIYASAVIFIAAHGPVSLGRRSG